MSFKSFFHCLRYFSITLHSIQDIALNAYNVYIVVYRLFIIILCKPPTPPPRPHFGMTYLDLIAVAPSCLLIVFKWSKDALHSCSTFVNVAAISAKSTLDARVIAPICVNVTSVLNYGCFVFNDNCVLFTSEYKSVESGNLSMTM